jgi:hypothetical protein
MAMFGEGLVEWLMISAINYLGILLFFIAAFEAIYYHERKEKKERDKAAEMSFFFFTATVVLNGALFCYLGRFGFEHNLKSYFLGPFFVLSSILVLLASFAMAWGRKRILLQFSTILLIACEAVLFYYLVTDGLREIGSLVYPVVPPDRHGRMLLRERVSQNDLSSVILSGVARSATQSRHP